MSHVYLRDRATPFHARKVEILPSGWLHAVGYWPRWDLDEDTDEIVIRKQGAGEYDWPPHLVKEVRHG